MNQEKKRLVIIDSNSIIHRAYHALPLLTTKKGETINALYGFLLVFLKAVKDFEPDYLAAAFDFPAPTFRHKKFKAYKAKRPPTPKDLSLQIPRIKQVLEAFEVAIFEKKGFEADDIIGTIANLSGVEKIILSGDSDILQLINSETKVYFLRRGVKDIALCDESQVREKFQGLMPKQIIDFKALKGDVSDNIPGVAGIGEKTSLNLILEFGNLDKLYQELKKDSQKSKKIKPKIKKLLLRDKKQAFFSKDLVTIKQDIVLDFILEKCCWGNYDKEKVFSFFKQFEFYSLIKKIDEIEKKENSPIVSNLKLW